MSTDNIAEGNASITSNSGEEVSQTPPAADVTTDITKKSDSILKTMSSKIHSSFSPGGSCSFPSRFTASTNTLVKPPRQRQRWDDRQMLPHTNWGDLFFYLFYVAAAYNLSQIILNDPTRQGILYFCGLFGPIMAEWFYRMSFDSRFALSDDPVHRLAEVVHLCFLATAVVHIRTVDVMSHPTEYPDMFAYALGLLLMSTMNICKNLELYIWVDGEAAAKQVAKRDVLHHACQGSLYLAATINAGLEYYGHSDGEKRYENEIDDGHRSLMQRLLANETYAATDSYGYYKESTMTDIPVWLCLGGYLFMAVHYLVMVLFCFPGGGRHKLISVPMNIDFCIHRLGEWTMLLLGESILSLLIVETSISSKYYVTFYAGIVSVVLLQYLHFRSQPHHADEHAMRRNKNAGMLFTTLMQAYSFALVAVGVSFKMLLYEHLYEDKGDYRLRRLLQYFKDAAIRNLAGAGGGKASQFTTDERKQRVADFFCGSLAIAWICLDLIILTHQGIRNNANRCKLQRTKKISIIGISLAFVRVSLIAFMASLSQYVTEPQSVAIIATCAIIAQVITRFLGDLIYPKAKCAPGDGHEDDEEEEKWPNVTDARARAPSDVGKDQDAEHGA